MEKKILVVTATNGMAVAGNTVISNTKSTRMGVGVIMTKQNYVIDHNGIFSQDMIEGIILNAFRMSVFHKGERISVYGEESPISDLRQYGVRYIQWLPKTYTLEVGIVVSEHDGMDIMFIPMDLKELQPCFNHIGINRLIQKGNKTILTTFCTTCGAIEVKGKIENVDERTTIMKLKDFARKVKKSFDNNIHTTKSSDNSGVLEGDWLPRK